MLPKQRTISLLVLVLSSLDAFSTKRSFARSPSVRPIRSPRFLSSTTREDNLITGESDSTESTLPADEKVQQGMVSTIWANVEKNLGTIDESRLIYPEYSSGEVPRLFCSISYAKQADGRTVSAHAAGSVVGAAALVAGTTVGAGVLALPAATVTAGFLPSSAALIVAWVYMTMSGLLIAELTLNRFASTGKPGLGLLELYKSSLGKPLSSVGSAAYFFLHYAMMVAYIAQGGDNLQSMTGITDEMSHFAFAGAMAVALFAGSQKLIERVNNVLVAGVAATFAGIIAVGAGSADFGALISPENQHPESVVNCFPILFLSLVYQNIVPTIVSQLEGDRSKIIQAIVAGTTIPMLMFVAWNAVVLGNVVGLEGIDTTNLNPVALLQSGGVEGNAVLAPLVSAFSSLALVTSLIGFTYGLVDGWTDVLRNLGQQQQQQPREVPKAALYALIFAPPAFLSVANPDIFLEALDYGGAFGVSTLFLVLPPIMAWKERYGDTATPLVTKPLVPLGKLPLGSMWKAAATLIVEQGAEKLGILDYLHEQWQNFLA